MALQSNKETTICYLRHSVAIDVSLCGLTSTLTRELFVAGNPKLLISNVGSGDFHVTLYDKCCGNIPEYASRLLQCFIKQKRAKIKAVVGIESGKINHSLVIITITGIIDNALSILSIVQNYYGVQFRSCVSVPPLLAVQPGIRAILKNNLKRPSQSSSDSNLLLSTDNVKGGNKLKKQFQSASTMPNLSSQVKIEKGLLNIGPLQQQSTSFPKSISLASSGLTLPAHFNSIITSSASFSSVNQNVSRISNATVSNIIVVTSATCAANLSATLPSHFTSSSSTNTGSTLQVVPAVPIKTSPENSSSAATASTSCVTQHIDSLLDNIKAGLYSINRQTTKVTKENISSLTLNPAARVISTCYSIQETTRKQGALDWSNISVLKEKDISLGSEVLDATQNTIKQNGLAQSINGHELGTPMSSTNLVSNIMNTSISGNTGTVQSNAITTSTVNANVATLVCNQNNKITTSSSGDQHACSSSSTNSSFAEFMKNMLTSNNLLPQESGNISETGGLTYDGESTNLTDIPAKIMEKLQTFNQRPYIGHFDEGSSLLNERGKGSTCEFLLGRVTLPSEGNFTEDIKTESIASTSVSLHLNNESESDSDEDINFSANMIARHRRRQIKDPVKLIGANVNELYEDPADVANRNWGLLPTGSDPADQMFSQTPAPVVKKDKLDELFDLMSEFDKETPIEPCQAVRQTLLPHQKMGLNWMIERENTKELPPFWECVSIGRDYINIATRKRIYEKPPCVNGGILADDMGLGKTLTVISLILTNHVNGKPMFHQKKALPFDASEIAGNDYLTTKHKGASINIKKRKDGYIKPSATTKTDLEKPGFKFRQMYLQQLNKDKKKKKKKKKEKEQEDQMFISDSDDDEKNLRNITKNVDSMIRGTTLALSNHTSGHKGMFGEKSNDRKATLIVCPMSVLSNWINQLQEHVNPSISLQIYVYYGTERVRDVNYLKQYDIIMTTYGTLSCDFRGIQTKEKPSPLHQINWLRVVLDEGHIIRNSCSKQTKACIGLICDRRWILTGTPIQNRMTDLWSIIKFLRLEPFTNRKWWFEFVVDSMKRQPKRGEVIFNRVFKIVKHIAIRRLKTDTLNGKPIVNLPSRTVIVQKIKFSDEERKVYDAMHKDGKLIVCKYFRMNAVMKNYANVLVIIMRLRQLCCHPKLCAKALEKLQKAMDVMDQFREQMQVNNDVTDDTTGESQISEEEREKLIQQLMQLLMAGDSEECSICLGNLTDPIITRCAHVFCTNCIYEVIESSELATTCPLCRANIDSDTMVKVPAVTKTEEDGGSSSQNKLTDDEDDDEPWHSSAKVDFVMEALETQRKKDPFMKSLVVSQFTSFLDVLQKPIKAAGFSFVRLDGTMSQQARARVIDEFNSQDDSSPTLMLLSLTAGGVGLNLTAATRVFLLDPAWNPAIEEQCFDRCHRLGQTKDVRIIKVIVEDTVEDRMLILQKQKRELMAKAFGMAQKNPEERRAAALRDIATLLGLDFSSTAVRANAVPVGNRRTLPT